MKILRAAFSRIFSLLTVMLFVFLFLFYSGSYSSPDSVLYSDTDLSHKKLNG
jgi:hypothetical protein